MATSILLDDDSMITVSAIVKDGATIVSQDLPVRVRLGDLKAFLVSPAGLPTATTTTQGAVKQAVAQADFVGADVTALKVELNAFLTKLETAGLVAV